MSESESSTPADRSPSRWIFALAGLALTVLLVLVWKQTNTNAFTLADESLLAGSAQTLMNLGDLEEAEEMYTALLERSRSEGQFGTYHLYRGNIRYRQEQFDLAIEDYLQAIGHDPEGFLYQARWNLAQAYVRSGQEEQARQEFKAFQEEYGEELPQFTPRINMALHLLEP